MTEPHYAVSDDGTSIAWYDLGGNGPDLLLAHASGFCGLMWSEVAEQLSSSFRCIAFDTRGHGRSGRPDYGREGWQWEHFAEDAAAVIKGAHMEQPFGIGHSSGGATEVLLEQKSPGTFRALYLFEPILFDDDPPRGPWPDRDLAVRTRRRRASFASASEALDAFRSRGPFTTLTEGALQLYVSEGFDAADDGSVQLRCKPEDEAEVYTMATAHHGFARLAEMPCAATFAHGEHSTSFTSDKVREMAERAPNGRFEEFAGMGHFGPLEDPARFAEAVTTAFDL